MPSSMDTSTYCPRPVSSRARKASRMPMTENRPALMSATAYPLRTCSPCLRSGNAQESAGTLHDQVHGRLVARRTGLPVAGDRAVHQPRIALRQGLVIPVPGDPWCRGGNSRPVRPCGRSGAGRDRRPLPVSDRWRCRTCRGSGRGRRGLARPRRAVPSRGPYRRPTDFPACTRWRRSPPAAACNKVRPAHAKSPAREVPAGRRDARSSIQVHSTHEYSSAGTSCADGARNLRAGGLQFRHQRAGAFEIHAEHRPRDAERGDDAPSGPLIGAPMQRPSISFSWLSSAQPCCAHLVDLRQHRGLGGERLLRQFRQCPSMRSRRCTSLSGIPASSTLPIAVECR